MYFPPMGMFTSVVHPADGRDLQIKCGWDTCETYRVGDDVGAYVLPEYPMQGYLLDGAYSSYSNLGADDWVVISGGKVVAVESKDLGEGEVLAKHNVKEPARELWSEEAWAKKAAREAKWEKEWEKEDQELRAKHGANTDSYYMALLCRPFLRKRDYVGLFRSLFKVEPMPQGALPIYDGEPQTESDAPTATKLNLTQGQKEAIAEYIDGQKGS